MDRPRMADSMYDTLLRLPLFQGLTVDDLTAILDRVQLHFAKHRVGSTLVRADEPCTHLWFVIRGGVEVVTSSVGLPYWLTEYVDAPCMLEPQAMFGLRPYYRSTYRALTEVHTVAIDKAQVLGVVLRYDICVLNLLNIVCQRAQVHGLKLWQAEGGDVESRICRFVLGVMERPAGRKVFKTRMEDLAEVVGTTRLNVSHALHGLQAAGLLTLRRGEIEIADAARLREKVKNK